MILVVEGRHIRHLRILVLLGLTVVVEVQFLVQEQIVDQLVDLSFLHQVQEEVGGHAVDPGKSTATELRLLASSGGNHLQVEFQRL